MVCLYHDIPEPYPQIKRVPELKLSPQRLQRLPRNGAMLRLWARKEDVVPDLTGQILRFHDAACMITSFLVCKPLLGT